MFVNQTTNVISMSTSHRFPLVSSRPVSSGAPPVYPIPFHPRQAAVYSSRRRTATQWQRTCAHGMGMERRVMLGGSMVIAITMIAFAWNHPQPMHTREQSRTKNERGLKYCYVYTHMERIETCIAPSSGLCCWSCFPKFDDSIAVNAKPLQPTLH